MFSCTAEMQVTESGTRRAVVKISGRATIDHAHEMWEKLCQAFAQADEVALALDEVSEADLSLAQLVVASRKSEQSSGKPLALVGRPPESFLGVLAEAGVVLPIETEREPVR